MRAYVPTSDSLGKDFTVKNWFYVRLRQTKWFNPVIQEDGSRIYFLEGSKICDLVMQGNKSLLNNCLQSKCNHPFMSP